MELEFLEKWPKWLRWALAVPSAIIGYIILRFILGFIGVVRGGIFAGPLLLSGFADYIIFPFSMVVFPSSFAPEKKHIVAATMATLYSIFIIVFVSISIYRYSSIPKYEGYWLEISGLLLSIIIAILYANYAKKQFKKSDIPD